MNILKLDYANDQLMVKSSELSIIRAFRGLSERALVRQPRGPCLAVTFFNYFRVHLTIINNLTFGIILLNF